MCTPVRGSLNLTALEGSERLEAAGQSFLGLCKASCDSEWTYLLKCMLLCFMGAYTTGLTGGLIHSCHKDVF